ncbi:MAG: right-handed parallel beta-helix repeat-containing protein [Chloroflexota bacterium]
MPTRRTIALRLCLLLSLIGTTVSIASAQTADPRPVSRPQATVVVRTAAGPTPTIVPRATAPVVPTPSRPLPPGRGKPTTPVSAQAWPGVHVVSSSYASIQAAIDAVRDTGGSVRIPAGTHFLPAKIRVYSNVMVYGDGMDVTILKFAAGVDDHMMSNSALTAGNGNFAVRDLTLSGPGVASATSGCCFGLRLVNVNAAYVVRVAADNFSKDGFYLGYNPNQFGVTNTRLSGCRATANGRNGISITHGLNNIIDGCLISSNNRREAVAGIDLEPDDGLNVSNNKLVGNTATYQNVGIQMFRLETNTLGGNAICNNTASNNTSAGIYDRKGQNNVYVNNVTTSNGTNFFTDQATPLIGNQYASSCTLPALPDLSVPSGPPTPTPTMQTQPPPRSGPVQPGATPTPRPDSRTAAPPSGGAPAVPGPRR